jgi:competence protein ComEC
MKRFAAALAIAVCAVASFSSANAAASLAIYFIDVEGGQSTLIVTPAGQSLLVDTGFGGFDGRDPDRIVAAAKDAGISAIDYLLVTHFHADHVGGVPELARRLPIRTFVDHDAILPTDRNSAPVFEAYAAARKQGRHMVAKPGDRVPLKDVEVVVVSSGGDTITKPLAGGGQANAACPASAPEAAEPTENPRSTGFRLQFGQFRFIDLGDLSGPTLFALFCPSNLLGSAQVYLVPHHGGSDVVYPATFVVHPRVAILNNGEKKGGSPDAFENLRRVTGLEDVWQIHRSGADGARNFTDARVANLDERTAHWIKLTAAADGTFSVTNGRTGETKAYR